MALKNTIKGLQDLLHHVTHDLQKADHGNKAASQRVRTGTIKLEKLAKVYRKESIAEEKKTKGKRPAKAHKPAKAAHKPAAKAKKKPAHKVKASHLAVRRPSAKLPKKKHKR